MHGIGQTHAVSGRTETHLLLHTPAIPLTPAARSVAS
jgi:hypothetical protein